ncbi:MAG TPA: DUF948 domain-containing protein [Naasia sp.]|jgi:predicted cobalt transporter CbtA
MSGGDIAGLIAAGVFAILVALLAVPLLKLGKVFDQTTESIREATDGITPILAETTTTIREANAQLARVDTVTRSVAEISGNASALVALFAASVGGPLIRIAGFSAAVRAGIAGLRGAEKAATGRSPRKGSRKK